MNVVQQDYVWNDAQPTCAHAYLFPAVQRLIASLYPDKPAKILEIGCGNGHMTSCLAALGHSVTGIDVSPSGIDIASRAHPQIPFKARSLYDNNLVDDFGSVNCVLALEVVEHLHYPQKLFEQSFRLLDHGGYLIVSTPYHGYLKNLALSLVDGWDSHFGVGWDGGHVKFFSKKTLACMALDAGFASPRFRGVGRLPALWKSMIMAVQR